MQRFNAAGRRAAPGRRRAKDEENWLDAKRVARELDKGSGSLGPARRSDRPRGGGIAAFDPTDLWVARPLSRRADGFVGARPQQGRSGASGSPATSRRSSRATLREQWLVPEAPPLAPVVGEIRARCEEAGLRPPSYVAIRARAAALFSPGGNRQAALGQSQTICAGCNPGPAISARPAAARRDANRPHADRHPVRGGHRRRRRLRRPRLSHHSRRRVFALHPRFLSHARSAEHALGRAVPRPRHLPQGGVARSARRRACLANVRTAESKS